MFRKFASTATLALLAFALFAAFTPAAQAAAAAPECTLATPTGSWAYSFSGSVFSTQANAFVPAASSGVITFDGHGNASGSETFVVAGGAIDETYAGTYTENPNCTGTMTLLIKPSGQTVTVKFADANGDNEAYLIFATPGLTMTGTAKRTRYRGI